jgi:hypothetical protein
MVHPATKRRGADPHVPEKAKDQTKHQTKHQTPKDAAERKLEQGLEETMAGSDPVSITQPAPGKVRKQSKKRD